ncbi:hypothetical protein IWQ56_002538, partial [Coemansia nantahalensis]
MANIQLPAGTTVNLENVPLHQFYHLSLHPATPAITIAVYALAVHLLNASRSKKPSRVEAKRQSLLPDGAVSEETALAQRRESGPWMTTIVVLHNLALAVFSYWCATNYTASFAQTIREEGLRCA